MIRKCRNCPLWISLSLPPARDKFGGISGLDGKLYAVTGLPRLPGLGEVADMKSLV